MADESMKQGVLELLSDSEDFEMRTISDNKEHEPDLKSEQFDGNDIDSPNNEFPITRKENIKWLQQPFQSPTIELHDLETPERVETLRKPVDYFLQYFDKDIFETIAFNTNLYASHKNVPDFEPTNQQEIQTLIAIQLLMGSAKCAETQKYWDELTRTPIISKTMSRDRFYQLQKNLHVVNILDVPSNNMDKFIKVRSLYDQIKKKCNKLPKVRKLRVGIQKVPVDPTANPKHVPPPSNFRIFVLTSECGMVYDFLLFQGKSTELDTNNLKLFGFRASVVLFFAQTLKENSHFLYFGKFFSSYSLFERLSSLGIYAAGTIQKSRFANPPLLCNKIMSKMNRGSTYEIQSNVENACSIGLIKWFTKRPAIFCSNFITTGTLDYVQQFDENLNKYVFVQVPEIVKLIDASMVGEGKSKMLTYSYRFKIKSRKWTIGLIAHAFNLVASNAWLQYKIEAKELLVPKTNILDFDTFRLKISEELISTALQTLPTETNKVEHPNQRSSESTTSTSSSSQPNSPVNQSTANQLPSDEVRYDQKYHWPKWDVLNNATRCKNPTCPSYNLTHVYCTKCNIHLCLTKESNCFAKFHTRLEFSIPV